MDIQGAKTQAINQIKAVSEQIAVLDTIPLLDMKDEKFGDQLVEKLKDIGFVILENHSVSHQLIDKAFQVGREFFQQDFEAKQVFKYQVSKGRGYSGPGQQLLDQSNKNNDKKEAINLGHPDGPGQINFYPQNPQFIETSRAIYLALYELYRQILRALEKGLNLEQGLIVDKCCQQVYNQTLRYLYYPELTLQQLEKTGKTRAGAHSDYGTLTFLVQKPGWGQNGLRALSSALNWVKVVPPDYSIVLNLGDLFQHWTNDVLKSTIHKVEVDEEIYQKLLKGELQKAPERQSLALFCDPDEGQILSCLPGFGAPKYEPIDGKKYVYGRVKSTIDNQYKPII